MDLRYERNKYLHKVLWSLVAEKFELYKQFKNSSLPFRKIKVACLEEMRQYGVITSNEYKEVCNTWFCFACRQAQTKCCDCPCDWREVELMYDPDKDSYEILQYDIPSLLCSGTRSSAYSIIASMKYDIDKPTYKKLCNIIRDSWK